MLQVRRDKYMVLNGELVTWQPATLPYVFQDLHTLGYRARYVAQHIDFLNIASNKLFTKKLQQSVHTIEQQITQLLEKNHTARNVTTGVRLSLNAEGNYRIESLETSIYSGYVLRSLHPSVLYITSDMPWPAFPTSALLQGRELADTIAQQRGAHEALLINSEGYILSDAVRPLIMIREYKATFSPTTQHSVESATAVAACRHIGLKVTFEHFGIDEIEQADELMYVNYQGITSITKVGRHTFMHILSERIAEAIEELY